MVKAEKKIPACPDNVVSKFIFLALGFHNQGMVITSTDTFLEHSSSKNTASFIAGQWKITFWDFYIDKT